MSLKLMIPILDENLTLDDLSKESGFVGAFTNDINKPYLDNHIFLMYESKTDSHKKMNRYRKQKNNSKLYSRMEYTIDGKKYTIYVYPRRFSYSSMFKDGIITFSPEEKARIVCFWKGTDAEIKRYAHKNGMMSFSYRPSFVPEIDGPETKKPSLTLD